MRSQPSGPAPVHIDQVKRERKDTLCAWIEGASWVFRAQEGTSQPAHLDQVDLVADGEVDEVGIDDDLQGAG